MADSSKTSKTYETRQKTIRDKPAIKSNIDWSRTKKHSISLLIDSDESNTDDEVNENEDLDGSGGSSDSSQEMNEMEQKKDAASDKENEVKQQQKEVASEEEDTVVTSKQKRKHSVMNSSDSSSDSDDAIGKVVARRKFVIDEDDEKCENRKGTCLNIDEHSAEIEEACEDEASERKIKRRKNLENLKCLARKRRSRSGSHSYNDVEEDDQDTVSSISNQQSDNDVMNEDNDSMDDFIVKDDEDLQGPIAETGHRDLFSKFHINMPRDICSHLKRIINALLINAIDTKFLSSLYDRKRSKRYAKEMLDSLDHVDKRIISPRLVNLTTRSRWSNRYKERVECYPQLRVRSAMAKDQPCQACEMHRFCKYNVTLSGVSYNNETLEKDEFLPNDKQVLKVGNVCARRTEVYHQLKHFKYHLYQRCIAAIEEIPTDDKSTKELVEMCLSKLEEEGFIQENVDRLNDYLDSADFFQDEKID
ncbi:coiled-coil domain-containing protein 82 [Pelobates fuscus]|uniref:coiled-coil domain-containing protein 82 n=1 Tax=Pelobates fuscus TaxID=191477 RepID=UPI002FE436DE